MRMARKKKGSNAFWYVLGGIIVLSALFVLLTNESQSIDYSKYSYLDSEIDRPDAEFVVEKFNDFQCPSCAAVAPVITQVRESNDDVHVRVRHFPLPQFPHSANAAEAAECARDQGRFWAMYYVFFDNQQRISPVDVTRHARGLGLDMNQFSVCMENRDKQLVVVNDRDEGVARGVTGTPSVFINGEQVSFATFAQYQAFLNEKRQN